MPGVCALAFEELGVVEVTSGAFTDTPDSFAVSRKVGYRRASGAGRCAADPSLSVGESPGTTAGAIEHPNGLRHLGRWVRRPLAEGAGIGPSTPFEMRPGARPRYNSGNFDDLVEPDGVESSWRTTPLLNLFWTMLLLFLWVLWFFMLVKVITDLFRSDDLGGWAKAGWMVVVVLLPFVGVLIYLVVRGRSMAEREVESARRSEAAFRAYVREAAGSGTTGSGAGNASQVAELSRLAELRDSGALSPEEFQRAKDKILA